jgi:hypothetical protein
MLSVAAGADTLFKGSIAFRGDPGNTDIGDHFTEVGIDYGEASATLDHVFPGINLMGYDPDQVSIEVSTDTTRHKPVPSTNWLGLSVLIAILALSGLILYRRRQSRPIPG